MKAPEVKHGPMSDAAGTAVVCILQRWDDTDTDTEAHLVGHVEAIWEQYGREGLFALLAIAVAVSVPGELIGRKVSFAMAARADHPFYPGLLRAVGLFMAAIVRDDMDRAWGLFCREVSVEPAPRTGAYIAGVIQTAVNTFAVYSGADT